MRERITLTLVVLVAFATGSRVAWTTAPLGSPEVTSYTPDPTSNGRKPLTAISLSSSTHGFAVGYYNNGNTSQVNKTQSQRWDGSSWSGVTPPNPGSGDNFLYGVVTISSTEAWAVGSYINTSGNPTVMILHFTSGAWVDSSVSVSGSSGSVLTAVTANSASDVWAVGFYTPTGGSIYKTLTMHWDGSAWSTFTSPNVGTSNNKLYGVTQVPGTSYLFWAVGAYYDTTSSTYKTLAMRGDARNDASSFWSVISTPNVSSVPNCLRSVSALDSSNVWAVGFNDDQCFNEDALTTPSATNPSTTLIEKWDGTTSTWGIEDSPSPATDDFNALYGVSVASSTRVWAVGFYAYGNGWKTMVLGRDTTRGSIWEKHCSENSTATNPWDRLLGVDALSDSVAWAAGWRFPSQTGDKPTLIENYTGTDCFDANP